MLSAAERAVVMRALAALLIVHPLVGGFGLPYVTRWLARATHQPHQTDQPTIAPDRIVWLVEATASHLHLPATCLTRAIVAAWLLARSGCTATLSIGVRINATDEFAAHAWVSHNGRPLGPHVSHDYTAVSITTVNPSAAAS